MAMTTERPIALGPVRELIARMCRLQEKAKAEALGYDHTTDCFCGEGGFWRVEDTWPAPCRNWENDGHAIEFIEEAVAEKIRRYRWRSYARAVKVAALHLVDTARTVPR